jgi:hypothetical protein
MAMEDSIFQSLYDVISRQQALINELATKLEQLEIGQGGGGTGNASIKDYESDTVYERNTLLVDTNTETVYRVIREYRSVTVETDCGNGNLKLVGFESQTIAFNGEPTQAQLNVIPDDTLVAIYSASDTPYQPQSSE